MAESSAEKSLQPTPHRRQQAREGGQFAKSQELVAAAMLLATVASLLWLGHASARALTQFTAHQLGAAAQLELDSTEFIAQWRGTLSTLAPIVLPVLAVAFSAAALANVAQSGFRWSTAALAPEMARLNPTENLRRIFSAAGMFRIVLAMCKLLIVGGFGGWGLYQERETIFGMSALEVPQIAVILAQIVLWTALKIAGMLTVLALGDYAFQWWQHEQRLKMTPEEVREESRNLQGNPQVTARRRLVQRQMSQGRIDANVPQASLLITDGSELCVAVRYVADSMAAPVVVAKGTGAQAGRIGRQALELGVPIIDDRALAQALDVEGAMHQAVPRRLFPAVADALVQAYRQSGNALLGKDS